MTDEVYEILQNQKISRWCYSTTKHNADKIVKILGKAGIGSQAIHGNKSQAARQLALGNFKSGKTRVMVATDIAARGIDINELPLVINYDLPDVPETYVHRIGRTGRAGNEGVAITLYTADEVKWLRNIESKLNVRMEKQNLEGKVIARREQTAAPKKKKPAAPKRGRSAVADKRKAPKTGSNRRQKRK